MEKEKLGYLTPWVAALIGLAIGYIHHQWFYPLYFHGDAAAMHVLAKAMLDEKSLLPWDFSYGNQLIFFRSGPFIALALMVGLTGYKAFIIGSSLSISFWAVVLHYFLSVYFESRLKGLLFLTVLLVPLGVWDVDFVLGQQSHLSNVVLALGVVVFIQRYVVNEDRLFLFAGCVCLFLMSSEAPPRGLLVLAPVLIALVLIGSQRTLLAVTICLAGTFLLAYAANKILVSLHPISLNLSYLGTLSSRTHNEVFQNFVRTTRETAHSVSSLSALFSTPLSGLGILALATGMPLMVAYFGFFFGGTWRALKLGSKKLTSQVQSYPIDGGVHFISLTAVLGVFVGACAVATLNPDSSRHYLWAIFLAKLCLFVAFYDKASKLFTRRVAGILVLSASFLMSSWFVALAAHDWNSEEIIGARNSSEVGRKVRYEEEYRNPRYSLDEDATYEIEKISEEMGIRNIYGADFWRMMPLNTLLRDVDAQALVVEGGHIKVHAWLTRPSWSCVDSDVLYYLKDDVTDRMIEEKLKGGGGAKILEGKEFALWHGPRVWQVPPAAGCSVSRNSRVQ